MATYILLSTLTLEGTDNLKTHPALIDETNARLASYGIKVVTQYAVLGPYDFVNVIEAPDNETVASLSVQLAQRGSIKIQTLAAIPIEQFIAGLKKTQAPKAAAKRGGARRGRGAQLAANEP